jgi:hypothetical protein
MTGFVWYNIDMRKPKYLSSSNKTSKMIMDLNATVMLNAETEKLVSRVRQEIEALTKDRSAQELLVHIESHGTRVCKLKNADKFLNLIRDEEGLITERRGLDGIYLNIITGSRPALRSEPMFILRDGEINPFYMLHQFYKWYSLKKGLPGFDPRSQRLFRKYIYAKNPQIKGLSLDEMIGLREAIARDREATDYACNAAREQEGSKKAFDKLQEGGADI